MPRKYCKASVNESQVSLNVKAKGVRDTQCKKIQDRIKKLQALYKRKRGLISKAYNLSQLCDVKIVMAIHDPIENKVTQLITSDDFGVNGVLKKIKDVDCSVANVVGDFNDQDGIIDEVNFISTKSWEKGRITG